MGLLLRPCSLLTIRREIDLAVNCQEVVALPLAFELGGELLGRDSLHVRDASWDLAPVHISSVHIAHFLIIIEFPLDRAVILDRAVGNL